MKKRNFALFIIPLLFSSFACSTSLENSSSSNDSSGQEHTHVYDDTWHYDETNHWKECECGEKSEVGAHSMIDEVKVAPTYDSSGVMAHHCSVCGYSLADTLIPAMNERELCDLLNNNLPNLVDGDVFALRDYLISADVPIGTPTETDNAYFGYNKDSHKVVLYNSVGEVIYPTNLVGSNYLSFKEVEVSNLTDLKNRIGNISNGNVDYSSIKLTNNILLDGFTTSISITTDKPIEINMNEYSIDCASSIHVFKGHSITINNGNAVVVIKKGVMNTRSYTGYSLTDSVSCVSVINAKLFRAEQVHFEVNDVRGYAVIDSPSTTTQSKVKLNNCVVDARNIALAIQGADFSVQDSNINGIININGGKALVYNSSVSAKGTFEDVYVDPTTSEPQDMRFIENDELAAILDAYYDANASKYDKAILSSPDAVLVVDRRSINSSFSSPEVTIKKSTLTPDYNANVYGYGFRYIDLNNDPNKPTNNKNKMVLELNEYPKCSAATAQNSIGGYYLYEYNL